LMKKGQFLLLFTFGCIWFCVKASAQPTTNGLYAAIGTTKGTIYCLLRYDLVPRTVGNFVSLADGTKTWLDYSKAKIVQRPFYNGLTFHRVVAGFVIQAGSPNGNGTDDPGYVFNDEFNPALNNDSAGVLAMANSGTNSNGSQFYITLSPQSELDNHYTVFGNVVEGMDVVTNIGSVATDTNSKPLVPIIITNLTILRIGTAASNFNADAVIPPLPNPQIKADRISASGPDLLLLWSYTSNSVYRVCYSSDLNTWNGFYLGAYTGRYLDDFKSSFTQQFFVTVETPIDQ
jgi:peptidyl-prolyl cis-trans isomerase A (cyclophilin A)